MPNATGSARTVVDGVLAATVIVLATIPAVAGPALERWFGAHGSVLNAIAELAFSMPFRLVAAVPAVVVVGLMVAIRHAPVRRVGIAITLALAVLVQLGFWYAIYLQRYSTAGSIR